MKQLKAFVGCRAIVLIAVFVVTASISLNIVSAQDELTPERINRAIDGAVAYLKREQAPDGTWPEASGGEAGATALCTLALLNAGVPVEDPAIQKALERLRIPQSNPWTYSTALRVMVFANATPERDRAIIEKHVRWLERTQITRPESLGGWGYPSAYADNSNSQFAILALYEAERAGVKADIMTWRRAQTYWKAQQHRSGAWGYSALETQADHARSARGSMTCAGIGSLTIIAGAVQKGNARVEGDDVLCCQDPDDTDDAIQRGLEWLTRNFRITENPNFGEQYRLYYLYGLERIGRLTARRFIGDHDWYREGADFLLRLKGDLNDHWGPLRGEQHPHVNTSLALLFLTKGRRPTLMAKLQYDDSGSWNAHPNDVNNLTRFVESQWDLDLTWEVIDIRLASADDLLQAPVLYLCGGNSPLPQTEVERKKLAEKLRDYLDRGGFLFVDGYCQDADFDTGFRALMREVMPEPEYQLRLLPPAHPIWRTEIQLAPDQLRPLEGIDFGCRTSVVYSPPALDGELRPSLSCLWEVSRAPRGLVYSAPAQKKIDGALAIGVNILAYATNRELKYKYEIPAHLTDASANRTFSLGTIYIANLQHPGGCTIAPNALPNLLRSAAQNLGLSMGIEQRMVGPLDPAMFKYHLLYMHGRNTFRFTQAEQEKLRTFIDRGGTLFANSICASSAFTESFEREMAEIFPSSKLTPIPPNDPLLTDQFGGFNLPSVTVRVPHRAEDGGRAEMIERRGPPRLQGIRVNDAAGTRWAVVFSPYDISCALEKQNSLECEGYSREDAARIGLNVLLYSIEN